MIEDESLKNFLGRGRNGGNLLFCGSGFSANCLNFSSDEVGTAAPLHKTLNTALDYQYTDMQVAADEYIEKFGEHGLRELLTEKYSVSARTRDVDEILKYNWDRIYTTNYDNVIEQALTHNGKRHYCANNTELPAEVKKSYSNRLLVVHLHGALDKWDTKNFLGSCVLGRTSYIKTSADSNWGATLRIDYASANAVFFIGFSNTDFYLAEHLFSAEASRDKVFFINSEKSAGDKELLAKQKKFGRSFAIGKEKFAQLVSDARKLDQKPEIMLQSFERCILPEVREDRASVEQQTSFMVLGRYDPGAHFKDILEDSSSYRAPRDATRDIVELLKNDRAVALMVGGICSGKTTIFNESILRLQMLGNTVFRLRAKFHNMIPEAGAILEQYPDCIIAIDDCFSLKSDLHELIKLANGCGAKMLLSSRSIAYDSEEDIRPLLAGNSPFRKFDVDVLHATEERSVISCADRIGCWGANVSSDKQKLRILQYDNKSHLAGFLLNTFQSDHIRNRFNSELDLFRTNGSLAEKTLVLALYMKHIGQNVQENILSEMLQKDSVEIINSAKGGEEFISYDRKTKEFNVIPGINAREALKNFFEPKMVVNAVIEAVLNLEGVRRDLEFQHVFRQLMRYTQLKHVIVDFEEQNRFFDRLSEISFCNRIVLFWLQWSMAMREQKDFPRATQYLDEAYGRAGALDEYNTSHLDDQKAGLILDAIPEASDSAQFLKVFRESSMLLRDMIKTGGKTSHNYKTILSFDGFFKKAGSRLTAEHVKTIHSGMKGLQGIVQERYEEQQEGFIKSSMENALASIDRNLQLLDSLSGSEQEAQAGRLVNRR